MLSHKQLRYFVEIVDAGGFSAAAERLFIAQSALSRQVREMEQALGVPLLLRDSRTLQATPAGRSLYADARRILAALEQAAASARHAGRGTQGQLQLLHSSSVPLDAALQRLLRQHAGQHPGVAIEISQASSEHQALEIHEGRADVGLARAPILRRYDGMLSALLVEEPLLLAVPAGHVLAQQGRVALAALHDSLFVATPHLERGGLSQRVADLCRARGFSPKPAAVRSRKWAQLALVQAGLGIAIVPRAMGQLAPPGVQLLGLQDEDCTSQVLALWRRDAPALVQRFVEDLRASCAGDGAGAGTDNGNGNALVPPAAI